MGHNRAGMYRRRQCDSLACNHALECRLRMTANRLHFWLSTLDPQTLDLSYGQATSKRDQPDAG